MNICKMLVYGAFVAVTLHTAFQRSGGESDVTYIATLASVVRASELVNYIGLLLM